MADKSNWELITEEYYDFIGMVYECERTAEQYRFFGLVHGDDDYYYGMHGIDGAGLRLLSCVGSIDGHGYKLVEDFLETKCWECGEDTLTLETYSDEFGSEGVLVEGLEHYVCSNDCLNDYETPRQLRHRCDRITEEYEKMRGA